MTRSLSLSLDRETLGELATGDLAAVVAGAMPSGLTCPVADCLSDDVCRITAQPRCF